MDVDTINTYGLVFHWKGKNSDLKPILFESAIDTADVFIAGIIIEQRNKTK